MKTCSLNDFMQEIGPWLDKDYIKEAHLDAIEDGMASKKESKQSPHSEENEGDSSEQLKPGETMLRCALLLFFVESGSGFLLWV